MFLKLTLADFKVLDLSPASAPFSLLLPLEPVLFVRSPVERLVAFLLEDVEDMRLLEPEVDDGWNWTCPGVRNPDPLASFHVFKLWPAADCFEACCSSL